MPVKEFQVVLLAGGLGNRMYPLTEAQPKVLVPIANKPLLDYPLLSLQKAGFTDVLVVVKTSQQRLIHKQVVHTSMTVEYCCIDDDCGTADALRQIKDKIKTDFIVMSGDLITDAPFHHILDAHRVHNATVTSLLFEIPKSEDGKKAKVETGLLEYFGLVKNRIYYQVAAADVEEELKVRTSLLNQHPNITLHTNLMSAHLYIFKHWVLDLISDKKHISTIQGELVPHLIKCQTRTSPSFSVDQYVKKDSQLLENLSTSEYNNDPIKCVIYKLDAGYCIRVNTNSAYVDANRQITKGSYPLYVPSTKLSETVEIEGKPQIGNESLIGEGTKIYDKASIKKCVIGNHCVIHKNVKLTNCIIMDHVIIEEGGKLDNVIACQNSKIDENVVIKDCDFGTGYHVEKGTVVKNEKFGRPLSND